MYTVIANFNFKTPTDRDWFLKVLRSPEGLCKTRVYKGCVSIDVYTDQNNSDKSLVLWQKWDSKEDHLSYLEYRKETGLLGDVVSRLDGELNIQSLDHMQC